MLLMPGAVAYNQVRIIIVKLLYLVLALISVISQVNDINEYGFMVFCV